jgi:hypothetical protein
MFPSKLQERINPLSLAVCRGDVGMLNVLLTSNWRWLVS